MFLDKLMSVRIRLKSYRLIKRIVKKDRFSFPSEADFVRGAIEEKIRKERVRLGL